MSNLALQASFNSGEWAPSLFARVDMQKWRSGAALLENWFVDYRGGASTRPGTKYILQAKDSAHDVRVIGFQATANVGFALEFGHHYIRFFSNEAPIIETAEVITGATKANPCVLTIVGTTLAAGDWIFVTGVVGMTQLNNRYFIVSNVAGNLVTISDLRGTPVNSTGYTPYTSGGTSARIYTIVSPYDGADLALIKFAQNGGSQMILCHPGYKTKILTEVAANNWTLTDLAIGTTAITPTGLTITGASNDSDHSHGTLTYGYVVTSIDVFGQESSPSTNVQIRNSDMALIGSVTNTVSWTPAVNADHYRIYRAVPSATGPIAEGAMYGYIGFAKGTSFSDSNIRPDYTLTPPVAKNPFTGKGVLGVTITSPGTYTTVPTVAFSGGTPSIPTVANAVLTVHGTPTVGAGGAGYVVGDTLSFDNSVVLTVATVTAGAIATFRPITYSTSNPGGLTSGATPTNPVTPNSTSGAGTGATANLVWGVGVVNISNEGAGYSSVPTVVFTPAGATATALLDPVDNGNPSVPSFFQQRLVLAAPTGAPQTLYMSQTGNSYNYDIHLPVQGDDAITATIVSSVLNDIKSLVVTTAGLVVFTDKASWLINGGSSGSAVKPDAIVANAQSFVGVSDVPPIVANYDILFVQQKGSSVRDEAYNIYANVFTGTDVSIISSHLFLGHQILEWAWAEEPHKVVWAIREDGVMLTFTFMKEQEFAGWSHQMTQGTYKSVCAISEPTQPTGVVVDAIYNVTERTVAGQQWKYIEHNADRLISPAMTQTWWFVDAGLQYSGAPATTFSGAEHLAGLTVTGLADGIPITPFVMPASGVFTLPAASVVTVGLGYICDLQTMPLDLNPSEQIQGKVKKINAVVARLENTLNIQIGPDFDHLTPMKDTVLGNVSSMQTGLAATAQQVTGLYTGDARTYIASSFNVPGQYCIRQSDPLPATVLGLFPSFEVGDSK